MFKTKIITMYCVRLMPFLEDKIRDNNTCWVPVAHACNPSYLGGRDQEGGDLKPSGRIV
jgi:hypothetical protein